MKNWWNTRTDTEKVLIAGGFAILLILAIGLRLTIACTGKYCWLAFSVPNPFGG